MRMLTLVSAQMMRISLDQVERSALETSDGYLQVSIDH